MLRHEWAISKLENQKFLLIGQNSILRKHPLWNRKELQRNRNHIATIDSLIKHLKEREEI